MTAIKEFGDSMSGAIIPGHGYVIAALLGLTAIKYRVPNCFTLSARSRYRPQHRAVEWHDLARYIRPGRFWQCTTVNDQLPPTHRARAQQDCNSEVRWMSGPTPIPGPNALAR